MAWKPTRRQALTVVLTALLLGILVGVRRKKILAHWFVTVYSIRRLWRSCITRLPFDQYSLSHSRQDPNYA